MKLCTQCKTEKHEKEFNKNKAKKDGLNTMCKLCSRLNSKNYYNNNRAYHVTYVVAKKKKRHKDTKEKIDKIKSKGCTYCQEKSVCCMEFHHTKNKTDNIASMLQRGISFENILKEIAKCILVCANCHKKIHAGIIQQ